MTGLWAKSPQRGSVLLGLQRAPRQPHSDDQEDDAKRGEYYVLPDVTLGQLNVRTTL
jgi:hypothetical protein